MSLFIDNKQCIDCRICINECPDKGISVDFGNHGPNGNNGIYTIDKNKCTECIEFNKESKCAKMCPVDCILPSSEIETDSSLWNKWEKNKKIKSE